VDGTDVTVIISCTQVPAELVETLSSVQHQTVPFECLLSVPASLKAEASRLLKQNGFGAAFRVVETETRSYGALANIAIEKASGRFIAFLRSTDLLVPDYLQKVLAHCKSFNADAATVGIRTFGEAKVTLEEHIETVDLLASPWLPIALVVRRTLLTVAGNQSLSSEMNGLELADLLLRLNRAEARLTHLRNPLYLYRHKTESNPHYDRSLKLFMEANADLYKDNWQQILAAKDARIRALSEELAPTFERLKQDHEDLQIKYTNLAEKHEQLEEHHARSLNSIKVTGTHLLRAIFSRFSINRT
jgi:glycosyltransferase involved in cell wall biosynthesis